MTKFRNIPPDFNEKMYLKLNPDVEVEFKNNPHLHYENYGFYENRQYKINVPEDFNEYIYLKLNEDIKNKYSSDPLHHYLNYGYFENRKYKVDLPEDFNDEIYLNLHPDVKEQYSTNAKFHYCHHGYFENRKYIEDSNEYQDYYNFTKKSTIQFKVSVILSNYNNEEYFNERLETIYNQTQSPYEVIIMDHDTSYNSVCIIQNYIKKYPEITTKIIVNQSNKESLYYNWIDGIKLASGDLIWIAETKDYCNEDFIEKLNKCFNNLSVSIAYCKSIFVDDCKNQVCSIEKYLNDKWTNNFLESTMKLVYNEWSYLNIIPNVSSCIFKKPDKKMIEKIIHLLEVEKYKVVIEWLFYLLVGKCGSIAYTVDTVNYYRQPEENNSHNIDKEQYIYEHFKISEFILQNFYIDKSNIKKLYYQVLDHFVFDQNTTELMHKHYNIKYLNDIFDENKNNFKNILICNYSFSSGEGESFPIFLANELFNKDVNVFFLSEEKEETHDDIMKLLNKNICIFNDITNLNKIICDFNITHVNTHHMLCDHNIIQYKNKYNKNLKHIITDHGNYRHYYDSNKYIFSYIEDTPTKFIYIADKNKNNFISLNNNTNIQLRKIPICIPDYDLDGETITRETFGLNENHFIITLVSTPMREKGWEEMIEIVNKLNFINNNNIYLLIVGELNNKFATNLVEKNKLNNNIKFLGYQNQVKKIFSISNIGILPTFYTFESTPIALIECLYSNKPFITSNVGYIKNMLYGKDDYAGTLIDLNNNFIDINIYVNEIQKYINSTEFYNSKVEQIKYVLEKLNFNNMVDDYLNYFYEN
jgi:glycosyltransferase involved in cell wall biosynthesis